MRNYNNRAMTEFYKFLESNFKKNNTLLTYDLVNEYNDNNDKKISHIDALNVHTDFLEDKEKELSKWIKRYNNV